MLLPSLAIVQFVVIALCSHMLNLNWLWDDIVWGCSDYFRIRFLPRYIRYLYRNNRLIIYRILLLKWQKVELGISARNLVDADVFSKSDPMVVVEQQVRLGHFLHTFEFWNWTRNSSLEYLEYHYRFEKTYLERKDLAKEVYSKTFTA